VSAAIDGSDISSVKPVSSGVSSACNIPGVSDAIKKAAAITTINSNEYLIECDLIDFDNCLRQ